MMEEAWEDLAEYRYRQYLAGEGEAIPATQALDEFRAEVGLKSAEPSSQESFPRATPRA